MKKILCLIYVSLLCGCQTLTNFSDWWGTSEVQNEVKVLEQKVISGLILYVVTLIPKQNLASHTDMYGYTKEWTPVDIIQKEATLLYSLRNNHSITLNDIKSKLSFNGIKKETTDDLSVKIFDDIVNLNKSGVSLKESINIIYKSLLKASNLTK